MPLSTITTKDSFETWRVKINAAIAQANVGGGSGGSSGPIDHTSITDFGPAVDAEVYSFLSAGKNAALALDSANNKLKITSTSGGGYDISTHPGVDTSGLVDCSAIMLSLLTQHGHVHIPQKAKIKIDLLTMPEGTKISGPGSIVYIFTTNVSDATLTLQTDCTVEGVNFIPEGTESIARVVIYASNADNIKILNNNFLGTLSNEQFYMGYETYMMLDQRVTNAKVIGNTTKYGRYGCFSISAFQNFYGANHFQEPTTNGMQFYGGKNNTIQGNFIIGRNKQYSIDGGQAGDSSQGTVTGISFLTQGFLGYRRGCVGNRIIGNYVYGVTEEGISFDTAANSVYNCPENYVLPIATVQSIASSGVGNVALTIQEPTLQGGVAAPAEWAKEYYMIPLTGEGVGYAAKIISSSSSTLNNTAVLTFNKNSGIPPLVAGDKVLITCGMLYNEIIGNTIDQVTSGIILYGSSWFNKVEGNQIRAISTGIEVASVIAGHLPGGAQVNGQPAIGTGVQSYSGCCTVNNNVVQMDFDGQPSTYDRASSSGAGPICVGTWSYTGSPVIASQNPGMVITNNRFFGAKTSKIGGSYATQDPGNSTVTYPTIAWNHSMGGTSIVLNKTDGAMVGPNFKQGFLENYQTSGSGDNSNVYVIQGGGAGGGTSDGGVF